MQRKVAIYIKQPITVDGVTYEIKPDPNHKTRFTMTITKPDQSCKPEERKQQS